MATRSLIIEMRFTENLASMAAEAKRDPTAQPDTALLPEFIGVTYDGEFSPTALPKREPRLRAESIYDPAPFDLVFEPEESTYIVRAEVDEDQIENVRAQENVVGVFSDPIIEPCQVCLGSPAVGSDADVERLLCAASMRTNDMDGLGVLVAIVDGGINMAHLNAQGKTPTFDETRSWTSVPNWNPQLPGTNPQFQIGLGKFPVGHGTMCAFDACIAAPRCTLLDIAVFTKDRIPTLSAFLSDLIPPYRHLLDIMRTESRSLVVNNSWAQYDTSFDLPPSDPGNYSSNRNHPFNRIVGDLDWAGADIVFASGNCGAPCPDNRCSTHNTITGANGHPSVLSVAGVDTTKTRVGYSSTGPGNLTRFKPDISGYTHFRGSGAFTVDNGTSAAAPVVAGVVAAVRSRLPYDPGNPATHPAAIRSLVTSTAEDLGTAGYDFEHGFGVVNGCELVRRLGSRLASRTTPFNFCERYPDICEQIGLRNPNPISDLCEKYPELCHELQIPPPIDPPGPVPPVEMLDPAEIGYLAGYHDGLRAQSSNVKRGT